MQVSTTRPKHNDLMIGLKKRRPMYFEASLHGLKFKASGGLGGGGAQPRTA